MTFSVVLVKKNYISFLFFKAMFNKSIIHVYDKQCKQCQKAGLEKFCLSVPLPKSPPTSFACILPEMSLHSVPPWLVHK